MTMFDEDRHACPSVRLLSIADAARQCGVSARTLRRWINDGLPVHRMPGGGARLMVRISTKDLAGWLRQFRHEAGPEDNSQVIRLEGRHWIQDGAPSLGPDQGLDDRGRSRPGVSRSRSKR